MVILCDMSISDISFYIVECLFTDKTLFVMVWQYILMGIGIISILLGLYLLGKKILEFMAKGLEAAFRNKFPLDYWGNLLWVVHIFERYDFKEEKYSAIDAGSDCPGIKMAKDEEKIEIYLIAPLDGKYRIKVEFKNQDFKIEIPDEESEKSKELLEKLIVMNFEKDNE